VNKWGYSYIPTGTKIMAALSAQAAIEWNRFSAFQEVTVRLIAERMLLEHLEMKGAMFVQSEVGGQAFAQIALTHKRRYHLYCSSNCKGASALADEMSAELGITIKWTSQLKELNACEHFLLYLTSFTWTSGVASVFAEEVCEALRLGVPLLLVYEFPSAIDDDTKRGACCFNDFFGTTAGRPSTYSTATPTYTSRSPSRSSRARGRRQRIQADRRRAQAGRVAQGGAGDDSTEARPRRWRAPPNHRRVYELDYGNQMRRQGTTHQASSEHAVGARPPRT